MAIENLMNLGDYLAVLQQPLFERIVLAVLAIIAGIAIAKIAGRGLRAIGREFKLNDRAMKPFIRLLELFIFIVAIIVALNILEVDAAQVIIQSTFVLLPSIITLLLLLFLGFIIINLIVDITKAALLKVGLEAYLRDAGLSLSSFNTTMLAVKVFLFLIVLSASSSYIGMAIPFIDNILLAITYGSILLIIALTYHVFKEPISNFFLSQYIQHSLLKPGQTVKVGDDMGEVIGVLAQGTLLKTPGGYNVLIPNSEVVKNKIYMKRTRQDIGKLEEIRSGFVCQLPAYCGPASATMLLNFMGYKTDQEKIGKLAKTKVPGGTGPKNLIKAVKQSTNSRVTGAFVSYNEITNLKDELKGWLSEGALVILWFSKPALFKDSKGRGHFVLCIGLEGDELVIMDPSINTAGVYLIDYRMVEEAMAEHDKTRGYIVFSERGTPAYWRISEGLIYGDISAYKELSKGFERYLKRLVRKNETVHELISESVTFTLQGKRKKPKAIWKPEKNEGN